MPVLIRANVDKTSGWAQLRFKYDPGTSNVIKTLPGVKWNKAQRLWFAPTNALPLFSKLGVPVQEILSDERRAPLPGFAHKLRPYQQEAADFLVRRRGALLTMDPRTGKTPTAIAAACALMSAGHANALLILYPNSVRGEWETQLSQWANIPLRYLESFDPASPEAIVGIRSLPYIAIGCHYEILEQRGADLRALLEGRRYIVIPDEIHYCKNRKIRRTEVLWELAHSPMCVARWGLTGTPMRNRPRDLWALFEFCAPGSIGTYWQYAHRYCNAVKTDLGHWDDKGEANVEELAQRLSAISYRKTRQEVAAWLPLVDRKVVMCAVPQIFMRQYRTLEKAFAPGLKAALSGDPGAGAEQHLRKLTEATGRAKIPTAIQRALEHCERGVKVLLGSVHHDLLNEMWDQFQGEHTGPELPRAFCAGGWMTYDKRRTAIERWKAEPGPAILLANIISSGIGIDLSQADVQISLELPWVPAELKQWEDRIQDMHKGTRTTPPLYEYLLVKDTIDTAICSAQLKKFRTIDAVVGMDAETRGISDTLRGAGVVDSSRLGLVNNTEDAVTAALLAMQERLMGPMSDPPDTLALDVEHAFTDEEETKDDDDQEAAG